MAERELPPTSVPELWVRHKERIDNMGKAFIDMKGQLDAVRQLAAGLLAQDDNLVEDTLAQMIELVDELRSIPGEREIILLEMHEMDLGIKGVEDNLEQIADDLALQVTMAVDDVTAKPLHKNKEDRERALRQALREEPASVELEDELAQKQKERYRHKVALDRLELEEKNMRLILNSYISRVDHITARIGLAARA